MKKAKDLTDVETLRMFRTWWWNFTWHRCYHALNYFGSISSTTTTTSINELLRWTEENNDK